MLKILRFPTLLWAALFSLIAICTAASAQAREIFVAPTGSDTNTGSADSPFREIRQAISVLVPGDTVWVADGNYKGFDVRTGSAATTTTIRAIGSGAIITPTTDRGGNNPNNIVVWESTNLVLDGLRTFQAPNAGLRIVASNGVTVRNGVFGDNGKWGIVTSHCDDLLLENNDCYGSVIEHGIYVANSGDRPVVRGNRIHGNTNSGLRANGDITQGGDGIISGALIENNIIYDNGASGGGAMNFDGLQDGIIRNNLLYNNRATGIALFKGDGAAGPKGMQILNNTIIVPADGRYCLRLTDVIGTLTVRNNILYSHNTNRGSFSWNTPAEAAWTNSDYNLFGGGTAVSTDGQASRISMATWRASGHEPHSIPSTTLAALFVASGSHDYRLTTSSPAIDRGMALPAISHDIMGVSRPQGAAPDIGAYEYSSYETWKTANSIPVATAADVDTDGDGVPLLLEYALGMDPSENSRDGLPATIRTGTQLQMKYTRSRTDVVYIAEASTDLRTWTTTGVQISVNGSEVMASVPISGDSRFLRLRATRP
jgi:hypothetical protein